MSPTHIWTYRDASVSGPTLVGYDVEAVDGSIGKVDEATAEAGNSFIVVGTGPWIFGKRVMLPAGVVERVDHDEARVSVDRTKDEIKSAPEFDESRYLEPLYLDELGGYYESGAVGRAFDERL